MILRVALYNLWSFEATVIYLLLMITISQ